MTSYQKLKTKCEELQRQVDIFKNALTVYETPPEPIRDGNGVRLEFRYGVARNEIDAECRRQLNMWVAENLDEAEVGRLLELRKESRNGNNK